MRDDHLSRRRGGGTSTYSVVATLAPGLFPDSFRMMGEVAVYFEPAAVIVVLVLLGQVLELRARSQTSTAIRNLLGLAPKTARRIDASGSEKERTARVGSRYTRRVSWNRPVSILVVTILTGLPISGATCALLCDSDASATASAAGHHHGSTHAAEEPAGPSASARIHSVSDHDCRVHDGGLRQAATAAVWRSEQGVTSIPLALVRVAAALEALAESGRRFYYNTPPGTAPPTATPLVLRV